MEQEKDKTITDLKKEISNLKMQLHEKTSTNITSRLINESVIKPDTDINFDTDTNFDDIDTSALIHIYIYIYSIYNLKPSCMNS